MTYDLVQKKIDIDEWVVWLMLFNEMLYNNLIYIPLKFDCIRDSIFFGLTLLNDGICGQVGWKRH